MKQFGSPVLPSRQNPARQTHIGVFRSQSNRRDRRLNRKVCRHLNLSVTFMCVRLAKENYGKMRYITFLIRIFIMHHTDQEKEPHLPYY